MNIKLTKPERKELINSIMDDEIKSTIREIFQEKYQEILEKELKIKINRVVEESPHLFRDSIKRQIEKLSDDSCRRSFGMKSNTGGFYASFEGINFNPETKDKIIDKIYINLKKDFDIKELIKDVKKRNCN